ncbi:unnamed protein product [Closterium sp. NIES-53]
MDAEMASWKSTGTYVDKVPPPGANIVDGMWIFRVKRLPGSPPAFKARYVARGFSQRQGVDYFPTFSLTPKMTTLWVLQHVAAQRDYELHSLDFSTAFLQGILHEGIWLCCPPGFTRSFPPGTKWSLCRPVYGLRQAPREWHDTLRTTLAALGFAPSTADPSLFLRTDTLLPPLYVLVYDNELVFATADIEALTLVKSELQKRHTCTDLGELRSYLGLQITRDRAQRTITLTQSHMVHPVLQRFGFQFSSTQPTPLSTNKSLSAPPSDESVEPSGPYPELVGCLMYLMTCTRPDLAYPLSLFARYVAPGRHRKVHWDAAKRVLRYLCSTSGMGLVLEGRGPVVLTSHADTSRVDDSATSSCEAEIYAGAMAAQELRWLTYLLTDLGEQPLSPPVMYVDNKAMIALCQEHRTKHIALRYFLARDLQQRCQLRLAYVATRANTADVFTKALPLGDHQRFATVLGLLALLFLTGLVTTCSPPLCLWGLADPSGGAVLARSSTVLLCPMLPSGSLSGLHLPSFSMNLVSTAALQDAMVTTTTPGGQRVSICTCTRTGHHLATFTRRPGSSLYTLTTEPPQVSTSLLALACPAMPSLRRRAATRHSSLPMTAPLRTLHMDVWGPARISGQDRERYFLLIVDDYTRYTTVFPLRSKDEAPDVLIPWIHADRIQLRERFREDLLVLRLHSDRGGGFSSDILGDFCRADVILLSFMLPASPQKNGVAERRIGLVMEVARTSMILAAAPYFLWPFVVRYAAHQLNLWPRVSLSETSPTLRWTRKGGDASVFRFYNPTSHRVLSSKDVTFDESVPFYHPLPLAEPVEVSVDSGAAIGVASRGAEPAGAEPGDAEAASAECGGAEPEGEEPRGAEAKGAEPEGAEPGGAEPEGAEPGGAESGGAEPRGTASTRGPADASPQQSHQRELLSPQQLREWFARCTRLRSGAAGAGGPAVGGTGAGGAGATSLGGAGVTTGAGGTGGAGAAGPGGARTRGTGAAGAGGVGCAEAGDPGAGGTRAGDPGTGGTRTGGAGAGDPGARGVGAKGPGGGDPGAGETRAGDLGARGAGAGGAGAGGTGAGDPGGGGAGAGDPGAGGGGVGDLGARGPGAGGPVAGDPGAGGAGIGGAGAGGTGAGDTVHGDCFLFRRRRRLCCHLARSFARFLPIRAVRTGSHVPHPRPPPVLGTHIMALCPSSVPLRVPLPSPPASCLADGPDPESDLDRAASPFVPRLLATIVTDPSLESTAASALVFKLVDFAAACRLDHAASLVVESMSDCPPSVGGECALGTDVLEDR